MAAITNLELKEKSVKRYKLPHYHCRAWRVLHQQYIQQELNILWYFLTIHKLSETAIERRASHFCGALMEAVFGCQVTPCIFGFLESQYLPLEIINHNEASQWTFS